MLYRILKPIVGAIARVAFRMRIVGSERVPATGAFVFAPSHRSILDAFITPLTTRRRIRFMAKQELWKVPILGRIVEALGAFPVDRQAADRAALRKAMECVAGGDPLVIFPEGTRRHGEAIEDLHDGAAYVAARLQVPIVPVGIAGTEEILAKGRKLPRFQRVAVVVGEPVEPPARDGGSVPRAEVRALTGDLNIALQKAFDEARALRTS